MTEPSPSHEAAVRSRLKPPPNPLRMLVSPLGWGAVAYCATAIVGGGLALIAGILGLLVLPLVAWATANMEAYRLRLLRLHRPGPLPSGPLRHPWDTTGLREGNLAVWGIAVLFGLVDLLPGAFLVTLVLGITSALVSRIGQPVTSDALLALLGLLVILIAGLYVAWALASVQAILIEDLIRPKAELREQVDQLTTSRRELVDVFAAERRRIERDLHDGAQQHLVLLGMKLGEAEYALEGGRPEAVREALASAHSSMEAAMTSLRDTVRGIHPQILTDRGLADAVGELAGRQPVPVSVTITGLREPPEQLALAAYYLVSEAFTNAVKHAQATTMTVRVAQSDQLQVEVYDDGRGGAVVRPGHGLSGMIERVQAFGGGCWVSSPAGGPTIIRASFPHPGR